MSERSLQPDRLNFPRNSWEIDADHPSIKDGSVRIEESEVAPAFGQDGGGLQYRFLDENGHAISQGDWRRMASSRRWTSPACTRPTPAPVSTAALGRQGSVRRTDCSRSTASSTTTRCPRVLDE
jgi:hypothetical protein